MTNRFRLPIPRAFVLTSITRVTWRMKESASKRNLGMLYKVNLLGLPKPETLQLPHLK